jgi:hypothetical protein
MSASSG